MLSPHIVMLNGHVLSTPHIAQEVGEVGDSGALVLDHQICNKTKGYHHMTHSSFPDSVLMSRLTRTYHRRLSATSDCGHVAYGGNGNYDVQMRCT